MLTAICIILIVLSILAISIISEARVNLDIYGKENSICFFLFGIKVLEIDVNLVNDDNSIKLELKNKDKMMAELALNDINQNMSDALRQTLPNPFYNLDIVEIDVYAEYGGENAFRTAVISLIMENVFYGALLYLLSTQRVKAMAHVEPNFNNKAIILRVSSIFSITIADIIYGILFGKKGEKKNDIGK